MQTKLSDYANILVEKDYVGGVTVWLMEGGRPDDPWAVQHPAPKLAGLVLDVGFAAQDLAYWILERCVNTAVAKEHAGRFAKERVEPEKSLIWSIPVRGVRAWVEAHRQGELWNEPCESES